MLKLFVWDEYSPDCSSGLAFAIAENKNEAMKLVAEKLGDTIEEIDWGPLNIFPISKIAFSVEGGA